MKTNNKISAYILRGSTAALLFSCVIVALCSAINLPEQPPNALPPQDNAAFGANAHGNRTLSFADRVAYQSSIEDVYWRHRIWPDTNPGPKPSLDAVMSQAQIEKKVEDYLRNSQTLEDYWQRPITADQLQTEMERMASHTKQPEVLQELFEALGNDPFVIAECLARPVLAERFANGDPVAAEPALSASRTGVPPAHPAQMPPRKPALAGWLAKTETQVPMTMAAVTSANYTLPVIARPSGVCTDDTWTPTTLTNAPSARRSHAAVWTGTEMIVWCGFSGTTQLNTGGRYNPSTDSWSATSTTNAPSPRESVSAVWTGSEMIVWGGNAPGAPFNTGGRYDPSTDSWTATSTTNAPSPRLSQTAVWTGSEMILWGGFNGFSFLNTGGRYDPDTDSWTATSTTNAPSPRISAAVWTGSEMIVWNGGTGGRYDPNTDSWTATSTTNAPTGGSAAAWTGSEMIVYNAANTTGGRYDPDTDSWTATSTTNAPSARSQHSTVWTGSEMIIWGGLATPPTHLNTGGRYDPGTDSWTATSTTDAPSVRRLHRAVWTGSEMIVWGGVVGPTVTLNTGGRYCAQPSVCVFLQGSWKNHPEAWPVTELQLGNVTYNQQELLSILHEPVRGNGLVLLAHQLIAAKLNIANGADGSCIQQTLADAGSLIGDLVVPPVGNGYLQPRDVAGIAGVLGSYNEGILCAPSCDNGSPSASAAPGFGTSTLEARK